MDVKKGLNKWGAFDSFSGSGTGTFGFGPLLFHHHVDETPRDPYDTNKLMLNDPISFNPLDAISWARLDDSPPFDDGEAATLAATVPGGGGGGPATTPSQAVEVPPSPPVQSATTSREIKSRDDDRGSGNYVVASPASPANSRMGSDVSGSRASSVAGSSVGNMSRTFSKTSLVTPDNTSVPRGPGSLQARKRHRRQAKPVKHAYDKQQDQQQQQQLQPHPSSAPPPQGEVAAAMICPPTSTAPPTRFLPSASHPYVLPPPPPLPPTAAAVAPAAAAPPPLPPPIQATHPKPPLPPPGPHAEPDPEPDLLLCLGPHCSARFPTEAGLNAHYQAEHSFACSWASCKAATFTSNNALVWHVKAEHLLVCPVPGCCGMAYPSKKVLDAHLKVSDDRTHFSSKVTATAAAGGWRVRRDENAVQWTVRG